MASGYILDIELTRFDGRLDGEDEREVRVKDDPQVRASVTRQTVMSFPKIGNTGGRTNLSERRCSRCAIL